MFVYRGSKLVEIETPEADVTWSAEDKARAATILARWVVQGVSVDEQKRLLPCAVLLHKWPGTVYDSSVMVRLKELLPCL